MWRLNQYVFFTDKHNNKGDLTKAFTDMGINSRDLTKATVFTDEDNNHLGAYWLRDKIRLSVVTQSARVCFLGWTLWISSERKWNENVYVEWSMK